METTSPNARLNLSPPSPSASDIDKILSRLSMLEGKASKYDALQLKFDELERTVAKLKATKKRDTPNPLNHDERPQYIDRLALPWRVSLFFGGVVSCLLSLLGFCLKDDFFVSLANTFWVYSGLCCGVVVTTNPRDYAKERPLLILCGVLIGLPGIISGTQLYLGPDDSMTVRYLGLFGIIGGTVFVLLAPPAICAVVKLLSKLSNKRLNEAIMVIFRSLPSTLAATLYVSAEAGRCVVNAKRDKSLFAQCGNPLLPTFLVTIFIGSSWVVTTIVPYIMPPKNLRWSSIARLNMERHEGVHLWLMCGFSGLTVLLYAMTDNEGGTLGVPVWILGGAFVLVFIGVTFVTTYDAIFLPLWSGTLNLRPSESLTTGRRTSVTRNTELTGLSQMGDKDDSFTWQLGSSNNLI